MAQQPEQFLEWRRPRFGGPAMRLLAVLAIGSMLAACGPCGDFRHFTQGQIGACQQDPAPPR